MTWPSRQAVAAVLAGVTTLALQMHDPVAARGGAPWERVDFEVVLKALEEGESRLALSLLEDLAVVAGEAPEAGVYEALAARSSGLILAQALTRPLPPNWLVALPVLPSTLKDSSVVLPS